MGTTTYFTHSPVIEFLEGRRYFTISFSSALVLTVDQAPAGTLQAPAVADLNGDSKQDLVIAYASPDFNTPASLATALGNGDGTFALGATFAAGTSAAGNDTFTGRPALGDFNGDGKVDIAVANTFNEKVSVYRGNGDGTFQAPQSFNVSADAGVDALPGPLAVADLNADGRADLVVGNRQENLAAVLLGSATTTLGSAVFVTTADDPASLAVGDFNNDSKPDVAVAATGGSDATSGEIDTLLGTGSSSAPLSGGQSTAGPRGVSAAGDFNGDTKQDLAVAFSLTETPIIMLGNGDGTFQAPTAGTEATQAIAADFDQDGKLDLATGLNADDKFGVAAGNGDGTFAAVQKFDAASPGAGANGDFNNDGRPDLVFAVAPQSGRGLGVFLSQPIAPDLTGEVRAKLPTAVIGGAKGGKASVRVTNGGTEALNAPVTVTLYASADGTLDTATDTQITSVTKTTKLKVGKHKDFKFKFNFPANVADGAYTILAQVDSANTVAEANEANNVAASATQVTIAAPFINLTDALTGKIPTALANGKKSTVTVLVTNTGNSTASGLLRVDVAASSDQSAATSPDQALGSVDKQVTIKAGKSKKIKVKFVTPVLTPGNYFIVATVDTANTFTESNDADNSTVATTATAFS